MTPAMLVDILFGQNYSIKSLDPKFTQQVLSAHESEPRQPLEEKEMDLENNRLGLKTAKQLSEKNTLNKKTILQSFQQALQRGELIIINKTNKKSGDKK